MVELMIEVYMSLDKPRLQLWCNYEYFSEERRYLGSSSGQYRLIKKSYTVPLTITTLAELGANKSELFFEDVLFVMTNNRLYPCDFKGTGVRSFELPRGCFYGKRKLYFLSGNHERIPPVLFSYSITYSIDGENLHYSIGRDANNTWGPESSWIFALSSPQLVTSVENEIIYTEEIGGGVVFDKFH
jgi:hypothetical protein